MSGYRLAEQVSLAGRNTFRVPALAELMADVRDPLSLTELMSQPWAQFSPLLVLGEGSNLLLVDDVVGLTLTITACKIHILDDDQDCAIVRVDAGMLWNDLVTWSVGLGFSGLENMALIPGTVGACPIQNIGAYGVEVSEFIETVEAFDRETLRTTRIANELCHFAYRDSIFKQHPERWIISAVEFRLPRRREVRIDYAGVREELAEMRIDKPRPTHVAEAISRIRSRKLPNPQIIGNAGSFFKNPQIKNDQLESLKVSHPKLPAFPVADSDHSKLSAAWLIEQTGWKGRRIGEAGVSDQHALVIVNYGKATGRQILELARSVASTVQETFGITLEPEPRLIGADFRE